MKFSAEIEGVSETLAAFRGVEAGLVDLRQLGTWKAVASEFRKIEKQQFEGEGRGNKWQPLKPSYARIKAKKYPGKKILEARGDLKQSLTTESHPDHVFEEKAQEMSIGTKDPKARYHQSGTKNMAARPPIDITDADRKQLFQPIQDKLVQLVGNAKLKTLRGF